MIFCMLPSSFGHHAIDTPIEKRVRCVQNPSGLAFRSKNWVTPDLLLGHLPYEGEAKLLRLPFVGELSVACRLTEGLIGMPGTMNH